MSKGLVMSKWPLIGWSFWKGLSNTHTWVYIKQAINTLPEASCKEPCDPKSLAVEKAPCPSRASTLNPGLGGDGHWWPAHFCLICEDARTMSISAYFDEAFCVVNICPLASGQGPNPFHKKHQTAVRWSWLWATTKWTRFATTGGGCQFFLPVSRDTPSPSSCLLAHSPNPDQQLPYFCKLGCVSRWRKHLE